MKQIKCNHKFYLTYLFSRFIFSLYTNNLFWFIERNKFHANGEHLKKKKFFFDEYSISRRWESSDECCSDLDS